jgi:malto-oligosyltrehalose trehalohydrolase
VLENEDNESRHLARENDGTIRRFTAQWNDDVHHALHAAATGESAAYYSEYAGQPRLLARSLAEGFAFQGETMHYRGRERGEPCAHLPPAAFVSFIQNHDQVGNRAFGDRLGAHVDDERLRAIAATYLLAPQVPMLFMGEEWNARQPFQYFCDFHGALAEAVRQGRRAEFARFPEFADAASRESIPDPQAEETFLASKLDWDDRRLPGCAEWLRWYTRILEMRRSAVTPLLRHIRQAATWHVIGEHAIFVSWRVDTGERLRVSANLGDTPSDYPLDRGRVIWHEGEKPGQNTLAPWSVRWTLAEP